MGNQTNDVTADITPIFLFSLPRSGSTLTQRVLATHPQIGTAAEPWLLLPLIYARRRQGAYSVYRHKLAARGIDDFCASLPRGEQDYASELRRFVLRLYSLRGKKGAKYFLDKTPRYHFIAEEIIQLFPDGRFIFLWRNPLAIIASVIETWGHGRWLLHPLIDDLYDGVDRLVRAYSTHRDKAYAVRYEDLVGSGERWKELFAYLGLEFTESYLRDFPGVSLGGALADPTGLKLYQSISTEPLQKWKRVLTSPVRKYWCRRYLRWLGNERLGLMGYDLDNLLRELDSVPLSYRSIISDIWRMMFSMAYRLVEPAIVRDKFLRLLRRERLYSHF